MAAMGAAKSVPVGAVSVVGNAREKYWNHEVFGRAIRRIFGLKELYPGNLMAKNFDAE
jgi:hypothetical protein